MTVRLADCTAVLAHGAGSDSGFLELAFPPASLGAAGLIALDDRTGSVTEVTGALKAAVHHVDGPVIVGGVSLGAHAAAVLLADPPDNVVAGLLCLPAWTGAPDAIADMTAAAAQAIAVLGTDQVLADLDPTDWVTAQLTRAWALRTPADLVTELRTAARQPGPSLDELRRIPVPVAILALINDPLHPASVAAAWARQIRDSRLVTVERTAPDQAITVFGETARRALDTSVAAS